MATTGSNIFVGNQTISGSVIPAVNSTYDLGSPTKNFRHLYLSSASLYIDGTKVLGSTTQELQITTDAGQSFKILEAGSDTITLQSADGNITLATSGGGDVILDPNTGVIALKGTTTIYAGNRVLSSDGNAIHFGNSVTMTGSLVVTGYIETQELRTTYISSSILYRSGSTKFGDELTDTHSFTGSLSVSGSISVPGSGLVSGSSQITYSGLSGVPSGIISGSSQLPSGLVSGSSQISFGSVSGVPSGLVSGSSQVLSGTGIWSGSAQLPSGTVSGSAQITLSSTTGFSTYIDQVVKSGSTVTFSGLTSNADISTTGQFTSTKTSGRIFGNDSFGTNYGWMSLYNTSGGIQLGMEGSTGGQLITGAAAYEGIVVGKLGLSLSANNGGTRHLFISSSGDATFSGTGTFSGGGNTLTLKKGSGSPAIAFAGTSSEATGLIEGVSGGGIKFYTSTGTLSSPSWSSKLLITPSDGIKFGANAVSIIGTEGSNGYNYMYASGVPKIYLEAAGIVAFLNSGGVAIGKSSATSALDIQAAGANGIVLSADSNDSNNSGRIFLMRTGGTGWCIMNNGQKLSFRSDAVPNSTSGNERMYMDSSYNLILNNGLTINSTTYAGGSILPTSDASYNLGSTSYRWNNVYTTDLHLSNQGSQNSVDGTWGDWTLQEGENDIFMLNNRSGEKFKIILEKITE